MQLLADLLRLSAVQLDSLTSCRCSESLVAPLRSSVPGLSQTCLPWNRPDDTADQARFPHTAVLFAAALANNWSWSLAQQLFVGVSLGSFEAVTVASAFSHPTVLSSLRAK